MLLKIEYTADGWVDLKTPIFMTDKQFLKFEIRMKEIFENIDFHDIEELDKQMGDRNIKPKRWTVEELCLLVDDKTHAEVAKLLGREPFSVRSKRGVWLPEFLKWARKNG